MSPLIDHLVIIKSTDPTSGDTTTQYLLDGRPCPTWPIESPEAGQYIGLNLIHSDLADAEFWLNHAYSLLPDEHEQKGRATFRSELIGGRENHKVIKGLFFSAVTIYAKCFTDTKGRNAKFDESSLDPKFRECHQRIMKIRHNLIAHAGTTYESGQLNIVGPPDTPELLTLGIYVHPVVRRIDFMDDRRNEDSFLNLVKHAQQLAKARADRVLARIREKHVQPWLEKVVADNFDFFSE